METTRRACPLCDQPMAEEEGFFVCVDHGNWYCYGAKLLVRAPGAEAQRAERVPMPWEQLVPAS